MLKLDKNKLKLFFFVQFLPEKIDTDFNLVEKINVKFMQIVFNKKVNILIVI